MPEPTVCPECANLVPAQTRVNFLGFPKFFCPSCHKEATLPLGTARLVVYSLVALAAVGITLKIVIVDHAFPILGVIPALVIAALVIDFGVRSRHRRARERQRAGESVRRAT